MQLEFETSFFKKNFLMKRFIKIYVLFYIYKHTHIYIHISRMQIYKHHKKILWAINQAEIFLQKHGTTILIVVTNMYNSFIGCLLPKKDLM